MAPPPHHRNFTFVLQQRWSINRKICNRLCTHYLIVHEVMIADCCFFCSRHNLDAIIRPNGMRVRQVPPLTCQFESFFNAKQHIKGGGVE
jgi:hypothetical protein